MASWLWPLGSGRRLWLWTLRLCALRPALWRLASWLWPSALALASAPCALPSGLTPALWLWPPRLVLWGSRSSVCALSPEPVAPNRAYPGSGVLVPGARTPPAFLVRRQFGCTAAYRLHRILVSFTSYSWFRYQNQFPEHPRIVVLSTASPLHQVPDEQWRRRCPHFMAFH